MHKPNIPMRPITSGIGSCPHRLAKVLARPLTKALGSISGAHLKNSTDLINRLKNISLEGKKMASFDVKALFTNVPIDSAIKAIKRAIQDMDEDDLPVKKADFVKLVSLCINFSPFEFNGEEYNQHSGLAMGSPLSPVAACLAMEMLEQEEYIKIMGRGATWIRYVDDIMIVVPNGVDLRRKLDRLNRVNERIKFTLELEENGTLPFLDTSIMRSGGVPKFKVYRKDTNCDDFIHYYSAHSERIKSGVVIGFYLRAMRVSSEEYLQEEIKYIQEAFSKLAYPLGLLIKLKNKARKIANRRNDENNNRKKDMRYLTVPNSKEAMIISNYLRNTNINVVTSTGNRIGELTSKKRPRNEKLMEKSIIYKIPCSGCDKSYIGETGRGLKQRIRDHRADVRHHRTSNALVVHIDQEAHLPRWDGTQIIRKGLNKSMRKTMEAAYIHMENSLNSRVGFVTWANVAAQVTVEAEKRKNPG